MTNTDTAQLAAELAKALPLLKGLETGQRCADYAYAEADGFQAMTHIPEAFEALRCIPDVIAALTQSPTCCEAERERCAKIIADSAAMFRKLGQDARAHDLEFEVARIRSPATAIRGADQ